jgi:3D (Asp-Asp-Asp) domain-containing protein
MRWNAGCARRRDLVAVTAAVLLCTTACAGRPPRHPQPPTRSNPFVATAYCQGIVTASGARVRQGIVAADPAVLPLGTVIRVEGLERRYNREYHVLDTGRSVRGREIDVYMRDCKEAVRFGRRRAIVSIVRPREERRR